jgi:NTE family protein
MEEQAGANPSVTSRVDVIERLAPDALPTFRETYEPRKERRGNALCLSGGGARAALFHLGVLIRLNETGVLSQMNSITSVSGGSIMAAHLANRVKGWPAPGEPVADFIQTVARPFEKVVSRNLRTAPIARRYLFPRNWFNDQAEIDALRAVFEHYLNGSKLDDLPADGPQFVFCATDNVFGVNWVMSRRRIGDYMAGYREPPGWTVGRAAAASSCFPPVLNPMRIRIGAGSLKDGDYPETPKRQELIRGLRLSDGGLYDNLALEPVWKSHEIVISSDGGGLFSPSPDQGLFKRLKRYTTVMGRQATSLRKRWLISSYVAKVLEGTYMGVGTPVSRYEVPTPGYSDGFVLGHIAPIRTDLDAFSEGEIGVLQNHGYFVAEAARLRYLSATKLTFREAPLEPPHPDWVDEDKAKKALANSWKTEFPFGRGPWLRYLLPRRLWPARP